MQPTVLAGLHGGDDGTLLVVVLVVAGLASAILLGLALAVFARRRSRSYLLVALALAALVARTAVGGGGASELISPSTHHLVEHGLDVAMAALVIGAVVYARRAEAGGGDPR